MSDAAEQAQAKSGRRLRHGIIEDWRDGLAIFLMLFVAAVSGAVIARFWPDGDSTPQATTDLTERLAALETRFSVVTSATEPEIAAIRQRVAQLDDRLKAAEAALGTRPTLADGTKPPPLPTDVVASSGDATQRIAEIAKMIEGINTRLATLEGDKTLSTRLDEFNTKQDEQVTALASLKTTFEALDVRLLHIEQSDLMTMARRAAFTAAIANLMRATQGSGAFTNEFAAVADLAGNDPVLADIGKYSNSGLPTLGVLTATFEDASRSAIAAEDAAAGANWWSKLWANLSSLVTVRSTGEVSGDDTQARLTRAELRLKAGDLRAAVEELQPISGAARTALDSWFAQAEARVKLEKALAQLNTHAIAALAEPPRSTEPVPQLPTP